MAVLGEEKENSFFFSSAFVLGLALAPEGRGAASSGPLSALARPPYMRIGQGLPPVSRPLTALSLVLHAQILLFFIITLGTRSYSHVHVGSNLSYSLSQKQEKT